MSIEEVPPGYRKTDVGVIPEEWNLVLLPEVVIRGTDSIRIGPFGSSLKKEYLTKEGYKVFGQENVFTNDMVIGDRYIDTALFRKLRSYEILPEDFLISMMGTVGQCIVAPKGIEPGIMDSHLLRLRLNQEKILPKFLLQIFESWLILEQTKRLSVGGIMEGLSSTIIRHIKIPLPPLPEQRAIAAALSDADALITSLDTLIEKKRAIKQAAMQQLLTGRTRLPGFAKSSGYKNTEVGVIPEDWDVEPIGTLIDLLTGFPFPSNCYSNSGIRLLRGSNIKRGDIDWSDEITEYWKQETADLGRYSLNNGDLVISMDGSLVGKSYAQITIEDIPSLLVQRVARIRSRKIDIGYLKQFIGSDRFVKYSDSVKTVTAIPHISPDDIRKFTIPFPPVLAEQTAIATVLSDMDAEITALEERRDKAKQIKQGMMQQLLTGKVRLVTPKEAEAAV